MVYAGERDDFALDDVARQQFDDFSTSERFVAIVADATHGGAAVSICQQSPATRRCENDEAMRVLSVLGVSFFDAYLKQDTEAGQVLSQSWVVENIPSVVEFWAGEITDANRDKRTNVEDFLALSANFGESTRSRSRGDFNSDRIVDVKDFLLLSRNFSGASAAIVNVPEPHAGFLVLCALMLAGGLRLQRRSNRIQI